MPEHYDACVDREIATCLDLADPRSFFLFAGAGSGKTRSLVTALEYIRSSAGEYLKLRGKRVGVITYTNAACDEIQARTNFDSLIDVRTIHSFAWSLIDGFNNDIRSWLRSNIQTRIGELELAQSKGRRTGKARDRRRDQIERRKSRLARLDQVRRFTYSPVSDNTGYDALNHAEVLQLASHLLQSKPAMRSLLVGRYPILLVDESQDTNRYFIDSLFQVQAERQKSFSLGLFGDMMQRIYNDGKEGLGDDLPSDWKTPTKSFNHRCPKRVVTLLNQIRRGSDGRQQRPRDDAAEGIVRVFLFPSNQMDRRASEDLAANRMAALTGDNEWKDAKRVKSLTLEHRMAAERLGFAELFVPLAKVSSWNTSLLQGSLSATRFFSESVLDLRRAYENCDKFALARICKTKSPLLSPEALASSASKRKHLHEVLRKVEEVMDLWADDRDPLLREVLDLVLKNELLSVPDILANYGVDREYDNTSNIEELELELESVSRREEKRQAISAFLEAPFSQIEHFATYFAGKARFDTHQGVKGREFDRVMVIIDDESAKGFQFKYESLFGGGVAGDKTVEATRRLFYVTCSRAMKSLAIVGYTTAVDRVRQYVLDEGWFDENEIEIMTA